MSPGTAKTFWLGSHLPDWLGRAGVPLFISRNRLAGRRTFPRAIAPWALDSGGFTEIAKHGRFTVSPATYAAEVRRFSEQIGEMAWAAPQDWMCEPPMVERTGLSVAEHQARTIANYLELQSLAPDLPWIPVLQGWGAFEYFRHVEDYARAGVELASLPLVGVGSVCRRQATGTAGMIFRVLASHYKLRLHGFGVKTVGLRAFGDSLVSADSMAWSAVARREPPLPGHQHKNCANCLDFATSWRTALPDEWLTERRAAAMKGPKPDLPTLTSPSTGARFAGRRSGTESCRSPPASPGSVRGYGKRRVGQYPTRAALERLADAIDRDSEQLIEQLEHEENARVGAEQEEEALGYRLQDARRKIEELVEELRYTVIVTGPSVISGMIGPEKGRTDVLDIEPLLERLGGLFGERSEGPR